MGISYILVSLIKTFKKLKDLMGILKNFEGGLVKIFKYFERLIEKF